LRNILALLTEVSQALEAVAKFNPFNQLENLVITLISRKLEAQTLFRWENEQQTIAKRIPTLAYFAKVLKGKAIAEEGKRIDEQPKELVVAAPAATGNLTCNDWVGGGTGVGKCGIFCRLSPAERLLVVSVKELCSRCFSKMHFTKECHSKI
jgi:hypothetical protein